ncbi:hypothetical protein N658DRAFT_535937 [Parathielavia hyrcaniae]|uniref:DUF7025 domain-containing protein n=1 Tax=Parathielavia hyrcaniae TaxID=113614 RepID=A0AAN6T1F9_9PEZI|nr:hypothetical protein N658DRAFT_535937 [Parathielavia hyrcaniae]
MSRPTTPDGLSPQLEFQPTELTLMDPLVRQQIESVSKKLQRTPLAIERMTEDPTRQHGEPWGAFSHIRAKVAQITGLRKGLQALAGDDSDANSPTAQSMVPSKGPTTTSSTEMSLAQWSSIVHWREGNHPAFYVATHNSLKQTERLPDISNSGKAVIKSSVGRHELPEAVVFQSMRLLTYLDLNIHDGSLSWPEDNEDNVLCILRPFKFLGYFDDEIRTNLADLERIRQALQDGTEEEWEAEWQRNPPRDANIPAQPMMPQGLTLVELTGLVKEFRSLVQFLNHFITPARTRSPEEPVFFSDLWFTFPAGSLIYVKDRNVPQKVWRVIQRTGGRRSGEKKGKCTQFVIDCYYVDFDGNRYIPIFHQFVIDPFDGLEPVTGLPVFPLSVAEAENYIDLDTTVERGRTFIDCTRPSHRDYTGRNLLQWPSGLSVAWNDGNGNADNASRFSEWIDSEVMVDMDRAMHTFPHWRPSSIAPRPFTADENELEYIRETYMEKWPRKDIDEENLRVFAFVFRTRKWACLQLGQNANGEEMLRPRVPRPEPWNDLELPDGHKNLVQSLIESQIDGNTSKKLEFDLVRARECAAEANHRPLLPITCGDLGTSPKEVETKLQEAFQLAQIWNCVLLLDEADVFFAQRSEDDIQRNALV